MDPNTQLHNNPTTRGAGWPSQPIDLYEMGRMVEQLTQITSAVHNLSKAVQAQTETLSGVSRDMSELRDGLKYANNDIRKLAENTITNDVLDARLRKLGLDPVDSSTHKENQAFLTRQRQAAEERHGVRRHARNAVAAAVAVALLWWGVSAMQNKMYDTIKNAVASGEVHKP